MLPQGLKLVVVLNDRSRLIQHLKPVGCGHVSEQRRTEGDRGVFDLIIGYESSAGVLHCRPCARDMSGSKHRKGSGRTATRCDKLESGVRPPYQQDGFAVNAWNPGRTPSGDRLRAAKERYG